MDARELESKPDDQRAEEFVQGMISEAKAAGLDDRAIQTELGKELGHYVDMSKTDNPWFIKMIKELIRQNADLTVRIRAEDSLLDRAVMSDNLKVVKILLGAGMTVFDLHAHQYRPIIEYDKWDLLQLLMPGPLPQDYIDTFARKDTYRYKLGKEPWSPCVWAIKFGKFYYLKFLISRGFSINSQFMPVHNSHRELFSPLFYATYRRDCELIIICVELGANIFSTREVGDDYPYYEVPFTVAIDPTYDMHTLAKIYLVPADINACDPSGERKELWSSDYELFAAFTGPTMLHLACCTTSTESVKLLVELGADVNKVVDGYLPIQLAIIMGQYDTAEFLYPLTKMSKDDWTEDQLDKAYKTYLWADYRDGLDCSPRLGEEDMFRYLVDAGAKLTKEDDLAYMINRDESNIVQVLLESGAASPNVNVHHKLESYVLWNALHHIDDDAPSLECVKALLRCNPGMALTTTLVTAWLKAKRWYDEDFVDFENTTTIQEAILTEDPEIITVCVKAGCCLLNNRPILKYVGKTVTSELEPNILKMLKKFNKSPRSLQHLSKFSVLRCLGYKDVNGKIGCLEIPTSLQEYLKDIGC